MKEWQASFQAKLDSKSKVSVVGQDIVDNDLSSTEEIMPKSDLTPLEVALKDLEDNSKTVDRSKLSKAFRNNLDISNSILEKSTKNGLFTDEVSVSLDNVTSNTIPTTLSAIDSSGSKFSNNIDDNGTMDEDEADDGGYDTT